MSCPYLIKKTDRSYVCHYSFKKLGLFKAVFFCCTNLCLNNCEASILSGSSESQKSKSEKLSSLKKEAAIL